MQSDFIYLRPTVKEALQENEINDSKFGMYAHMLSLVCFQMNGGVMKNNPSFCV